MSQVHKVIILNKPLKIFDFTPLQLILLLVSTVVALIVGSKMPGNWKINGLPVGFLVGMVIFCGALVVVKMSEVKPWIWWKNLLVYRLRMAPTIFMPRPEEEAIYPDPTIIEAKKSSDEFYVEAG